MFKSPPSVQLVPSYSYVSALVVVPGWSHPPKINPAVNVPAPVVCLVDVGKLVTSVQEEPLYSSTSAFIPVTFPPANTAAVCIPKPPACLLAVFTFPLSVHDEPLYSSVSPF